MTPSTDETAREMLSRTPLPPGRRGRVRRRLGLSLTETLIALALSASLLTAVGAGFHAASQAVTHTDQFYRSLQAARQATNRVAAELRKCQSAVVATNSLTITDSMARVWRYDYDAANRRLTLTDTSVVPNLTVTLANDVSGVAFATDGTSVSVRTTVSVGRNTVTLSGSAMPRRSAQYR